MWKKYLNCCVCGTAAIISFCPMLCLLLSSFVIFYFFIFLGPMLYVFICALLCHYAPPVPKLSGCILESQCVFVCPFVCILSRWYIQNHSSFFCFCPHLTICSHMPVSAAWPQSCLTGHRVSQLCQWSATHQTSSTQSGWGGPLSYWWVVYSLSSVPAGWDSMSQSGWGEPQSFWWVVCFLTH